MMKDVEPYMSAYGDYYCLMGRIYYANRQPLQAIMAFIKALSCEKEFTDGSRFNIPHYNIGYINEQLGDIDSAIIQYKMCKNFPMAENRLKELGL